MKYSSLLKKTDPEKKPENAKLVLLIVPAAASAPDWRG